jgi:hypothetical protein
MCALILSTVLSEIFFILRRTGGDMTKTYVGRNLKYPSFLSHLDETSIFLTGFQISTHMSNFMKIRPVGAELFRAERQTDRKIEKHHEAIDTINPTDALKLKLFSLHTICHNSDVSVCLGHPYRFSEPSLKHI